MKKFLFLFVIFIACNVPCKAVMTTDQALSPKYIRNHGYSDETARLMYIEHKRINGALVDDAAQTPTTNTNTNINNTKPVSNISSTPETLSKKDKFQKGLNKLLLYLDPGRDNGEFGGTHSISPSTGWYDY